MAEPWLHAEAPAVRPGRTSQADSPGYSKLSIPVRKLGRHLKSSTSEIVRQISAERFTMNSRPEAD